MCVEANLMIMTFKFLHEKRGLTTADCQVTPRPLFLRQGRPTHATSTYCTCCTLQYQKMGAPEGKARHFAVAMTDLSFAMTRVKIGRAHV